MEKVTPNGFPKHGNHPLVKGLQLLGVPCQVHHIPFGHPVEGRHIFIKRDPRNALVAWLRMREMPETPGIFITAFRRFQERSLVEEMAEYEAWQRDPDTLVVRYEYLIADADELKRIAAFLGIPYIDGAFENLPGMTRTWTGPNHSDYRAIWTPEVESVWAEEGGNQLLAAWGYA